MHYFIFSSKDSYITENSPGHIVLYPDSTDRNYGNDEILELKKEFVNSYSTSPYNVSRIFTQFDYSDISSSIVNGDIKNPKFYLRLYEVEGQSNLDKTYSLESLLLSQDWNEGVGNHFDNPKTTDGISWKFNSGSHEWGFEYGGGQEESGSRTTGGGSWFKTAWEFSGTYPYQYMHSSQSFQNQSGDIEMNVTDLVFYHLGAYVNTINKAANFGFITKFSGSSESDETPMNLKFFSRNTHTIYAPKLEVRWDDHKPVTGSNTGSLTALTMSGEIDNHIFIKGLQQTYRESEKVRFRMGCRKKYTPKSFTESTLTSSFYIPEDSGSYSIVDVSTNTNIVPFSDYTKLSCDSTSMYFDQWLNTFEPGRYYKILFKLRYDDGQEHIIDNDEEFKVI